MCRRTENCGLERRRQGHHLTNFFRSLWATISTCRKVSGRDISDTARVFQENSTVIKALVAKFPELREAFAER